MQIIGLGTDIVETARIKSALERFGEHFYKRICSAGELNIAADKNFAASFFAGRWAAKEAAAKALGCGIGENCSFNDIEILNDPNGRPVMTLYGNARIMAENLHVCDIKISISHENNYAVATVILSGREK